ncbi:MAG: hypothetical protein MJ151_03055, partial [Lachnospiraceae bacterium]|nr:hypothetical protein [Lachnospiraceae bacterium]
MNKKDNISIPIFLLTLIISSMISFFMFILLLHTPIFGHMKVYMYRGIVLIILSTIFNVILLNIL